MSAAHYQKFKTNELISITEFIVIQGHNFYSV